jgi:hypothetical protein
VNGEIGPLPRSVNREEAKRDDAHLVKVRIGRAEKLAGDFRGRVGTDGLCEMQTLGKGYRFRNSVNRGARRENEPLNSGETRRLEQMERATHIRVVIKLRLPDRRPHPRARREMRHGVEFFPVEKQVHRAAVAQIDPMDRDVAGHGFDIGALDLRVVKIVEIGGD